MRKDPGTSSDKKQQDEMKTPEKEIVHPGADRSLEQDPSKSPYVSPVDSSISSPYQQLNSQAAFNTDVYLPVERPYATRKKYAGID
eukprot:768013-Hanusia_phi.AAC.3